MKLSGMGGKETTLDMKRRLEVRVVGDCEGDWRGV